MSSIMEALKNKDNILRLSGGSRWLVWDDDIDMFIVYERKPYQKKTRILIETESEEEAVNKLVGE